MYTSQVHTHTHTHTDAHKHINTPTPPVVLQCAAALGPEEAEAAEECCSLGCAADLIDTSVCVCVCEVSFADNLLLESVLTTPSRAGSSALSRGRGAGGGDADKRDVVLRGTLLCLSPEYTDCVCICVFRGIEREGGREEGRQEAGDGEGVAGEGEREREGGMEGGREGGREGGKKRDLLLVRSISS
jgi:hypothetical protein